MNADLWCTIELDLSIIGGSVPTMKPFVKRHFPRLLGLTSKQSGSSEPVYRSSPKRLQRLKSLDLSQQLENIPNDGVITGLVEGRDTVSDQVLDV